MDRRIVLDEPEEYAQERAPLFHQRGKRGKVMWKYTRSSLARYLGMQRSGVRSAEKRKELVLDDIGSVARFVVRRLDRRARRALTDKKAGQSVTRRR